MRKENKKLKINIEKTIVWFFIVFNFCFVSKLDSQTYLEYNYLNGSTTSILFSVISTGSSANTSGNQGVLVSNTGSDTGSSFFPLNIVNDPSSYPWRIVVQIGGGV
ncbi:MAG TPA: hypothetical protein VIL99_03380 [Ignavibacteria bacterium]